MMTGVSDGRLVPDDVRLSGEILLGLASAFERRPLPPPPPSAFQPLSRFGMGLDLGSMDRGREQTRRRSVSTEGTEDELEVRLVLSSAQARSHFLEIRRNSYSFFAFVFLPFSSAITGCITFQLFPFSRSSSSTSTSTRRVDFDRRRRPQSATLSQASLLLHPPPSTFHLFQRNLSTSKIFQYLVVEFGSHSREALLGWEWVEARRRRRSLDDGCYGEGGC